MEVYRALTGSRGRGTERADSDYDICSVVMPTEEEFFEAMIGLKNLNKVKCTKTATEDISVYNVTHFILQLAKGNFNAVDALYSKVVLLETPVSQVIKKYNWLTTNLHYSLRGYVYNYLKMSGPSEKDSQQAWIRLTQLKHLSEKYLMNFSFKGVTDRIIRKEFCNLEDFDNVDIPDVKEVIKEVLKVYGTIPETR